MGFITDYQQLNPADAPGNWTTPDQNAPTLGSSSIPMKNYLEGGECMEWYLKKGVTDGYTYTSVIPATVDIETTGMIVVFLLKWTLADIDYIPISAMSIRISSDTGFTTDYGEWNARSQIIEPYNTPIAGYAPCMIYPTNPDDDNGTPDYSDLQSVGINSTTGGTDDGKQGSFDMIFAIGYIGLHSETHTNTFFDELYEQAYDDQGGDTLPNNEDRPLFVISRGGDFFQTNVKIQFGDGAADNANLVVSETGKTIFFSNVEPEHELGYVFVDPNSTYENRLTLVDCVHFWTSQQSGHEIFTDATYAAYFQLTGCAFSNGGKITLPSDSANRWVRTTKFANCQAGTASDGEFTDCILQGCYAMVVSADADFTGTQVLESAVAADASAFEWNGNYDPDTYTDGMSFSKGTNAHHAIGFSNAVPTTMTLRNIDFSGFTNTIGNNAAPLYFADTTGTVTVNLIGCTGITADGYKSAGATIVLVVAPVTTLVHVDDHLGASLSGAQVWLVAEDGTGELPFEEAVTSITRSGTTATVTHTAHGMASGDYVKLAGITDKIEDNNGAHEITWVSANSYTYVTTNSGSTSYTGSITATGGILHDTTDVSGNISRSRTFAGDQNVGGQVRKSTSSPRFKTFELEGNTIDDATGLTVNVRMVLDE